MTRDSVMESDKYKHIPRTISSSKTWKMEKTLTGTKKEFKELLAKVDYEGGWESMLNYSDPPNIYKFPSIAKIWDKLKFEFEELEGEINFYANELGLELDNMDGM